MLSALISSVPGRDAPSLADDLEHVGIRVRGDVDCAEIVQASIRTDADMVICYDPSPPPTLFACLAALMATAPRPVVLFTCDPDAGKLEQALKSGVSAYVIDGYASGRLRSVIHLAMARFRLDRDCRAELADLRRRFAERTLVDRAKGILMGARQLREEEAYRALRTAAMHAKQRIGQVAQVVIDGALYAEAINRAGQFRMLSQRLVKLYALASAQVDLPQTEATIAKSIEQTDANLAALGKSLSRATFGDLLDAVALPWSALKAALTAPPALVRLEEVNRLADDLLLRAERLTDNLEITGLAAALHVINVSGRQRMLSQRLAKEVLLAALLGNATGAAFHGRAVATRTELLQGLAYLAQVPLTNAAIRSELDATMTNWQQFETALNHADSRGGQLRIATLSERLLANFECLTEHYEKGMQTLLNWFV